MAELMCPVCDRSMQSGEVCDTCFISPVPRPASVSSATGALPAPPGVYDPAGGSNAARSCPDPDCVHGGAVPPTGCGTCGATAAGGAKLLFPWGSQEIPPGGATLRIGRENSPIAGRLADYSNVSRRHAEVTTSAGLPVVIDLGSANGTFVNGDQIPPRQPRPLRHGDSVRFAGDLIATIDLGPTR